MPLERGDDRSPARRIRSRKRQPELTQYMEIGNDWGIGRAAGRRPGHPGFREIASEIDEYNYANITKMYDIESISILDNKNILRKKFLKISGPMVIFVNKLRQIMYVNVSDFNNENKSEAFISKIIMLGNS